MIFGRHRVGFLFESVQNEAEQNYREKMNDRYWQLNNQALPKTF